MKKLIDIMLDDLSTEDVFRFRVSCDECGREYADKAVRFSKAGVVPQTPQKKALFQALYAQEHQSARVRAVREATEPMNYCPMCKRLVCNRCFLICDDLDMCKQCAAHLEETGSPVLNDVLDSAS